MLSLVDNISTRESREGVQIFYFKKRFNTCFSLDKSASLEHPMRRLFYNFDNEPKRQRNISARRGDSEVIGMSSVFRVRTFVGVFITLLLAVHLSSVSAVADESSVAEDAPSTPLQSIASSQEGAQNETTDTAQGKSHGASTAPEGTAQPSESAGRGSSSTPNAIPNNSSSADNTGRESDSSAEQQQPVNPAQNANSGWVSKDGKKYYYDPTTHALRKGWLQLGNSRYYLDPTTGEMRTGVVRVGGKGYLLAPSGAMRTGWAKKGGTWYLAGPSGALRAGWAKDGGTWYYLDPQTFAMRTGWAKDGGTWYYMDPSGAMRTGWLKDGGTWYYMDPSGAMRTGVVKISGKTYVLDSSGALRTNCIVNLSKTARGIANSSGAVAYIGELIDGQLLLKSQYGKPVVGWKKINGSWFYASQKGVAQVGWKKIGGSWYYFDKSGLMLTGWQKTGGTWYYLNFNGSMRTGWLKQNGAWYYLDDNGAMATGWRKVNGTWYYFLKSGAMAGDGAMAGKAQGYSSNTGWMILVDTSNCTVGVFRGSRNNWSLDRSFACSPGAYSTPTVKGQFTVQSKGYSFGSGFTCYYYTQFYGNYLFHSVLYYQGTRNILDGRLGMHLSHGCVRLQIDNAKWIYNNIPRGTKVVVY